MVSADAGRSWRAGEPPAQITSLAIDPTNERHRYNEIAKPFDWNFTRADLTALLERLDPRDETSTIPLAA